MYQLKLDGYIPTATKEKLHMSIAKFLATSKLPSSLVSTRSYKEHIMEINTAIQEDHIPNVGSIQRIFDKKLSEIREWQTDIINKDSDGVSIVFDKWPSGNNKSFFGITGHKINVVTGVIDKYLLDASEFEESATADAIAKWFNDVMAALEINISDITSITVDTESAQLSAFSNHRSGSTENVIDVTALACVCHVLDLIGKSLGNTNSIKGKRYIQRKLF